MMHKNYAVWELIVEKKLPETLSADSKCEMMELVFITLTLHLDEKNLREVSFE